MLPTARSITILPPYHFHPHPTPHSPPRHLGQYYRSCLAIYPQPPLQTPAPAPIPPPPAASRTGMPRPRLSPPTAVVPPLLALSPPLPLLPHAFQRTTARAHPDLPQQPLESVTREATTPSLPSHPLILLPHLPAIATPHFPTTHQTPHLPPLPR